MKRKCLFLLLIMSIMSFSFWLAVWTSKAESQAHFVPRYEKENIADVLEKDELSDADYELLFRQAGMTRVGVDELLRQGEEEKLLYLQERLFEDVEVECLHSNFFVQYERIVEKGRGGGNLGRAFDRGAVETPFLPQLQNGDILISFSGHIFGWRYGHAAIVVDAARGITVEAVDIGSKSRLRSVEHWDEYPGFALLRVKLLTEQREEAARYARENLVGLPYSLLVFGRGEALTGTHCAHLVWRAYEQIGCDLDGDGGWVVTPEDLYRSGMTETVQVYGLNLE